MAGVAGTGGGGLGRALAACLLVGGVAAAPLAAPPVSAAQKSTAAQGGHALRLPARPGGAGTGQKGLSNEPARPLPESVSEAITAAVAEDMSRLGIPGLSIALAEAADLRFAAGYGFADVENEVEATPDTVYRYASVSKPVTATAALRLSEQGRLDLDAPVWRYCAAYPPKPWPVSSRQLLCHQGGVRSYAQGERALTRHFGSVPEGLVVFKDDPLAYEPGTAVQYSTYGYCLLGCAVEGAAGRPFIEVLREEVFAPAGMTATAVDDPRVLVPHRASGYVRTESGDLVNSALADMTYKVPGGGLCGTAPDVARFGSALVSGRLVGRATLAAMLTPQKLRNGHVTGFGLGLTIGARAGRREAWHIGGQERVSTLLYLRPDTGLSIGILSNLEKVQTPLLDLARRVADLATAEHPAR
ncbi:MAG TPA: serine hydrolase domain-containing protein [Vicinamibacteria bacterium]|nr:serine hydrolase domain-containing protein [Vicinamibacteria bacterium]